MKKIFSIPLNPKLNEQQFADFYTFCESYKDWISDIYFTSRIAPFDQDAMGDLFVLTEHKIDLIENALNIQKYLGIPISATFNNTTVKPTQKNLDLFIKNFKPLYDSGIRIATIPHSHWMATGQIKAAFPELYVKNTILRDVRTAVEIVNLAKYGFDYINLDRDLMRDSDTLKRLKQAKEWIKKNLNKEIQFSLLANEGCLGACPMMVEHFEYNNTRQDPDPQYFNNPISRISCPKWEVEDPAVFLKTANLPPWKEDWDELLNDCGIDVFKMHGRESVERLYESMDLIKRYVNNEEYLWEGFQTWLKESNLEERPIMVWRDKIKNCKFDCWECQYCDKIQEKKSPWDFSDLVKHTVACVAESGIPKVNTKIPGLTSIRVQTLLNSLAKGVGSYLEIGSYLGATACAVLKDNTIKAYFVDQWQEQIQPARPDLSTPENNKNIFLDNIDKFKGLSEVAVIDSDLFEVPLFDLTNQIQMFFYDGPHDKQTTKSAVEYYWPAFQQETILIFDDANWPEVVEGANLGIQSMGGQISYQKLMLNDVESSTEWWNGLYILVVRKS
jgi:predicted O-methyltransferase YrrM